MFIPSFIRRFRCPPLHSVSVWDCLIHNSSCFFGVGEWVQKNAQSVYGHSSCLIYRLSTVISYRSIKHCNTVNYTENGKHPLSCKDWCKVPVRELAPLASRAVWQDDMRYLICSFHELRTKAMSSSEPAEFSDEKSYWKWHFYPKMNAILRIISIFQHWFLDFFVTL